MIFNPSVCVSASTTATIKKASYKKKVEKNPFGKRSGGEEEKKDRRSLSSGSFEFAPTAVVYLMGFPSCDDGNLMLSAL